MPLSENKDILTIYLEDTTLPAGLSLCLQQFQSVFVSEKNWQTKAMFLHAWRRSTSFLNWKIADQNR